MLDLTVALDFIQVNSQHLWQHLVLRPDKKVLKKPCWLPICHSDVTWSPSRPCCTCSVL